MERQTWPQFKPNVIHEGNDYEYQSYRNSILNFRDWGSNLGLHDLKIIFSQDFAFNMEKHKNDDKNNSTRV